MGVWDFIIGLRVSFHLREQGIGSEGVINRLLWWAGDQWPRHRGLG